MRKVNNKSIFVIITIIFYLILSLVFLINNFGNVYFNIINPIFWIILFVICFCMFRNEYVNKKYKYDILQTVIITIVLFFILYYLLGFVVGFQDTPYSSSIKGILKNLWSFGIIIFFQEYIRQVLINRSRNNKFLLFLITIIFILADISKVIVSYKFDNSLKIFQFIVITLNPAIARGCLLTYLTYTSDYIPSLIYRLIMETYSFIVPFIPNFNWFLIGVVDIVLPFFVFVNSYRIFEKREEPKRRNRKKYKGILFYTPIFLILTILIILVSGVFHYKLIAIASNSMNPVFYRGDAVLMEKLEKDEIKDIKVGDIIVYDHDGSFIVHRVIEKVETLNGTYLFKTKGDNNNGPDSKLVESNQVVGKFIGGLRVIGYPSVLLQEFLAKG